MDKNNNVLSLEERFGGMAGASSGSASAHGQIPTCPDWLCDVGKEQWAELAPQLASHGIINALDAVALGDLCSTIAVFIDLEEQKQEAGKGWMFQKAPSGYQQESPLFTAWKSIKKPLLTSLRQLGLTPPSRVALKLGDPGQEDLKF